jgi:hypothetical protein
LAVELCECLVTVGHFGIYQAYQVNYTCILIDVCVSQVCTNLGRQVARTIKICTWRLIFVCS